MGGKVGRVWECILIWRHGDCIIGGPLSFLYSCLDFPKKKVEKNITIYHSFAPAGQYSNRLFFECFIFFVLKRKFI